MKLFQMKNSNQSTSIVKASILATSLALLMGLAGCSKESTDGTGGVAESIADTAVDALDLDHEDVFSISVGTCFDDEGDMTGDDEVSSVPVRECSEPHDNEVYFAYDLTDPELPQSDDAMYERCQEEFEKFVGASYDDSIYDYDIMTPTLGSWEAGDREVICFAYDAEYQKLTGTVKGAAK